MVYYPALVFDIKVKALTINKAFRGRRWKTSECVDYEEELWFELPNNQKMIKGEVVLTLTFYLIYYGRTDVSNLVKILEDILVKKGYIEDDRKVVEIYLKKIKAERNSIKIKIEKYEN